MIEPFVDSLLALGLDAPIACPGIWQNLIHSVFIVLASCSAAQSTESLCSLIASESTCRSSAGCIFSNGSCQRGHRFDLMFMSLMNETESACGDSISSITCGPSGLCTWDDRSSVCVSGMLIHCLMTLTSFCSVANTCMLVCRELLVQQHVRLDRMDSSGLRGSKPSLSCSHRIIECCSACCHS